MTKETKGFPSQVRLKDLFHYDPETGIFTRKTRARFDPPDRKYGRVGAGRISELGYVLIMVDGTNYIAGRLAWCYMHGEWPHARVKYLDGDKINNRLSNIGLQNRDRDVVKATKLTAERLKEVLHYEPSTGWFTWRIAYSTNQIGARAGNVHGFGYRMIGLDYKKYLEHSLAWFYMTGEYPTQEIDHINGQKDDNSWSNLRAATRSEQGHNKPRGRKGALGFPGVSKHGNKFKSAIALNHVTILIGWFATIAQARIARLLREKEIFGRFTTYMDDRDGTLPMGDGFINTFVKNNTLYVQSKSGELVEVTDANAISYVPVTQSGETIQ